MSQQISPSPRPQLPPGPKLIIRSLTCSTPTAAPVAKETTSVPERLRPGAKEKEEHSLRKETSYAKKDFPNHPA